MFWNKKDATAKLPLEQVRFTDEDLFLLMGGMDIGSLVCSESFFVNRMVLELDKDETLASWKKKLIDRFEPLGLVDAQGTPSDELAQAVATLSKSGVVIVDGLPPKEVENADRRRVAISIYDGQACAIRKAPGFKGGWNVMSLGPREQWHDRMLELFELDRVFKFSPYEEHVVVADDPTLRYVDAFSSGNKEYVRLFATKHGIAPDGLLDIAEAFSGPKARGLIMLKYLVNDFTGCELKDLRGYSVAAPRSGSPRVKQVQLFPTKGFSFAVERAPYKGAAENYWEIPEQTQESTFGCFDFIREGSLLERLCAVDTHPSWTAEG